MTTHKISSNAFCFAQTLQEKSKMLSLGGMILLMLTTMSYSYSLSWISTKNSIYRRPNHLPVQTLEPFNYGDSRTAFSMFNIRNNNDDHYEYQEEAMMQKKNFDYGLGNNDSKGNNKNANDDSSSYASTRRNWLLSSAAAVTAVASSSSNANAAATTTTVVSTSTTQKEKISLISSTASCDSLVSVWKRDGRIIYLLGSAHISKQSAETAGQLVRDTRPDAVFVELDIKRATGSAKVAKKFADANAAADLAAASNPKGKSREVRVAIFPAASSSSSASSPPSGLSSSAPSSKLTLASSGIDNNNNNNDPPVYSSSSGGNSNISNKNAAGGGVSDRLGAAAVGGALKGMYKKLDSAGFDSGGEFVAAINEGRNVGAAIVLGDQDVDITLSRLSMALKKTDFRKLLKSDSEFEQSLKEIMPSGSSMSSGTSNTLASSTSGDDAFKQEFTDYIETMKAKENVKKIMDQLKQVAPALYEVMVSERDSYMAAGLNSLDDYKSIVAVMGVAHVDGVEHNLQQNGWKDVKLICPPTTASIA